MAPRNKYSEEQLAEAVERVAAGESSRAVSKALGISYSVVRKNVGVVERGGAIVQKRRGPPPLLPVEAEKNIAEWIIGLQIIGTPCGPQDVIDKANELLRRLDDDQTLGSGWYRRFLERNPCLGMRQAQVITRARNEIDTDVLATLLWTMAKLVIEERLDETRVFNVDETAFFTRKKSRRVLAVKGSPNVWCKAVATNFHLSIVAAGSASGFILPPFFVLPGERVSRTLMDEAVPGSTVTTTPSGFMNAGLFGKWIKWFASQVPDTVRRPLVVVMDGYRAHYSLELVQIAASVGVFLVCLPANATHLLQPLDVSVFSALKKKIRSGVQQEMLKRGTVTISKADAVRLGSAAWLSCNFPANLQAGFKTTGLFPPSLPAMMQRFNRFQRNGVRRDTVQAAWLQHQDAIRTDVLVLPSPADKTQRKRKTVDVEGRLLTRELLHAEAAPRKAPRTGRATAMGPSHAEAASHGSADGVMDVVV